MRSSLLACALLVMGCGSPAAKTGQTKADLASIVLQYHQYVAAHRSPPTSEEELATFKDPYSSVSGNQASSSRCATALRSGNYVVIWSYDVARDLARNESLILAYHKDVPTTGGYVSFADGVTRLLDKDQFAAMDKAPATSQPPVD